MSIEQEIQDLTQSTTDLLNAVNTKKVTLDNSVAQALTAVTDATSQVALAAAEKVGAQTARDEAETHKNNAYTYSQSAASAVAYQDLTAIAQTKAESAFDVFVYDTSKDSDGGAWRQRTQHTSWYNEPLNTATRGSRKEFPAVAVIVALSTGDGNQVRIYDGDDPSLPMWMVISDAVGGAGHIGTKTSVAAINGKLVFGILVQQGLRGLDFVSDTIFGYKDSTVAGASGVSPNPISLRNQTVDVNAWSKGYPALVSPDVNDVAMTVLPDAPIDQATGLPIPTIAVATDGGVSVIKDDGTVVDGGNTSNSTDIIVIDSENNLWWRYGNTIGAVTAYPAWLNEGFALDVKFDDKPWSSTLTPFLGSPVNVGVANAWGQADAGFVRFGAYSSIDTLSSGLYSYTTSTYNTGWMNGDIKLATLSDTDDTDLVGSELVTNGTFDTDTSGWTNYDAARGTISVVSGKLRLDNSGTGNTFAYQGISTVVGKKYVCSATSTNAGATTYLSVGSSIGTGNLGISQVEGTTSVTFTATTTTTYIQPTALGSSGYVDYDNISVRLAEPDRSVNNNGLQVFGTVQKNPVATGADLVAYSGFSASNYLEQPYNPDLDFGTGDYCIMAWVKPSDNTTQYFFDRQDGANSATGRFNFGIGSDRTTIFHRTDSALLNFNYTSVTGKWAHYTLLRKNGVVYVYVDGQLIGSASNTVDYSSSFNARFFAIGSGLSGQEPDSAALLRISGTAPTAEQIKKIYEDEKVLFQENAKATLHGTSDAVTALAYDDTTELLHVGTSAGRSVFQGLKRVDNTTDAVGVAISASNGLVAEE